MGQCSMNLNLGQLPLNLRLTQKINDLTTQVVVTQVESI